MSKIATILAVIGLALLAAVPGSAIADETWTVNWSGKQRAGGEENHAGSFTVTISSNKRVTLSGSCPDEVVLHGQHNLVNTRLRAVNCSEAFDARLHALLPNRLSFEYSVAPACAASYDDTFEFTLTNGDTERGFYRWSSWKDFFGHCTRSLRADYAAGHATGLK
jgi:hypothetical protein